MLLESEGFLVRDWMEIAGNMVAAWPEQARDLAEEIFEEIVGDLEKYIACMDPRIGKANKHQHSMHSMFVGFKSLLSHIALACSAVMKCCRLCVIRWTRSKSQLWMSSSSCEGN